MTEPTARAGADTADLPKFYDFFAPVLGALVDGQARPSRDLIAVAADLLDLDAAQRAQVIPSGQRRLDNRVHWALSYLYQAGVVDKPRRGVFEITDRGRALQREHPHGFDVEVLRRFEEFQAFEARASSRSGRTRPVPGPDASAGGGAGTGAGADDSPLERIASAVSHLDSDVADQLVKQLHDQPPEFLEKAVLQLLVRMGYGGSDGAAQHLGGPGDGGFDGVINEDRLGLQRVYVQAKRYAPGQVVGRPAVQGFLGALHHAGAAGGVFITTSHFSPDAVQFAASITPRVILIDGPRLGELMVRHGVGVREVQVFTVVELDEDFFE